MAPLKLLLFVGEEGQHSIFVEFDFENEHFLQFLQFYTHFTTDKNIRFFTPEAPSSPESSPDIFKDISPPSKPEERWPALSQPSSSASSIQPAQKVPSLPASWTTKIKQNPKDYNKIRKKYEKYLQGNRILPIPELVQEVQQKIISYVVTDLKTKRLAGIKKKNTFEGLLKAADIPAKYYCRRSFATWDVLLPSEDLAAKLAGENVISKYFRLQPEYMGRRKI